MTKYYIITILVAGLKSKYRGEVSLFLASTTLIPKELGLDKPKSFKVQSYPSLQNKIKCFQKKIVAHIDLLLELLTKTGLDLDNKILDKILHYNNFGNRSQIKVQG